MQRILIIDDDHHILLMIKKMLERAGFEVDLASNGNEGLELFKKMPVDLVITDIIMPEKEGLETIREMKRLRPDLKIIAMSGGGKVSSDNYLNTAKIFGASRTLAKPFSQKQMVSAVQDLLGKFSEGNPYNGKDSSVDGLEKEQGR
ncbi:MAG: response regulator [Bacteroidales bacterium]|nr:response regulator [Bacteroidales bacterium]